MATKPRLIYANRWRDGTIGATLTSENPQHPATDSQIDTKSMFWRTTNDTDDPTLLPCDLGAEYDIDFVALLDHNIPDTATIYFEGADNEDFEGDDFVTEEIDHNTINIFQFFTSFKKQWVRVRITTPGNDDDYIQIATVICGKYFEPNQNFDKLYSEGIEDYSEIELSDSIILFSQEKSRLKTWILPFHGLDDTSKAEVLELLDECGIHKAFVIVFDSDTPNSNSHLVRLAEFVSPAYQHIDYWNWELAIKEII